MRKNIILIPPCETYGDTFSVIGLYYYLLNHYEKVYLHIFNQHYLGHYYNCYLKNDERYGKRLFLTGDVEKMINEGEYGEYDICNVYSGCWTKPHTQFKELPNVDPDYYFTFENPLYNKLNIEGQYLCKPNKILPNYEPEINHIIYYELVGLNNKVRMDYFNYERNKKLELITKNNILKNEKVIGKYNIINDPIGTDDEERKNFITNGLPTINISNLTSECVGTLTTLVEDAEEIHFIEGNNVNFFYHLQYKNKFYYDKEIKFHVNLRNRDWMVPNMMMDKAWKMMDYPRLDNWNLIF